MREPSCSARYGQLADITVDVDLHSRVMQEVHLQGRGHQVLHKPDERPDE
jgi:hypothetical protein